MDNKIKNILKDLYKIDPKLKTKEKEIISFVEFLLNSKPEIKLDQKFITDLHEKIKQEVKLTKSIKKISFENKNNFFRNTAYFSFVLTFSFVFIVTFVYFYNQSKTINLDLGGLKISQVESNKFGVLNIAEFKSVDGRGSGETESYMLKDNSFLAQNLIYNPVKYNYNYIGDDFEIKGAEAYVYKYKNISNPDKDITKIFKNVKFGLVDINKFDSLGLNYLSLTEDKDFGYSINFDFVAGTINIGENYEKWPNNLNLDCVYGVDCFEKTMLQAKDMLSDEEIIKIADNFLSNYKIEKNNYADPVIQNNWQTYFESDEEIKEYIPETVQVIYPLLIDGKKVYDEGAYPVGLNVNVNIRHKKVAGVYNLRVENYESSLYKINTNTQDILSKAKDGGFNSYLSENSEIKNVNIDSPELALIRIYNYTDSGSEELLVPGLIFTVKNKEENYSGKNNVIVILVEGLIEERDEPVYRIM